MEICGSFPVSGIALPILSSASSRCPPDVTLCRGTLLLDNCAIGSGARLGENCLVGGGVVVEAGAHVPDHTMLSPGVRIPCHTPPGAEAPQPKSLAATLARETDTLAEVIRRINWASMEIILVVNDKGSLL